MAFDELQVDAIFRELNQCQLPGAAVGVAIDGVPVYRKGFGLANMELPQLLSPAMRMRIASMSKHFAALAFLLLCEEGKATIDDRIGQHLPELHPVNAAATYRQLLTHTSGLRDAFDLCHQFSGTGQRVTSSELLSFYRTIDDVNAPAGLTWNYNNGGYLLLSHAIERIADRSLEEVLRTRIFDRVGMHDTQLRRFDTDFVPNSATLHMTNSAGGFEKSYMGRASDGEGGIVSTVDDMLRWLAHMDRPFVGSASTWQLMRTPQRLANGTCTGYGLGLILDRYRGAETLWHGGGLMGCNSHMIKVPGAGLDIVIMVNRHDVLGFQFVHRILDACLPWLEPAETLRVHAPVIGIFRSPLTGRVVQFHGDDRQQYVALDGFDMPVALDSQGVLKPVSWASFFKLGFATVEGAWPAPRAVQVSDFGNIDELVALESDPCADTAPIHGVYRSATTGTQIAIVSSDEGARLLATGRFGSAHYHLESLARGIWRARSLGVMPWGAVLSFDLDGAGFRFTSARNHALAFRRDE